MSHESQVTGLELGKGRNTDIRFEFLELEPGKRLERLPLPSRVYGGFVVNRLKYKFAKDKLNGLTDRLAQLDMQFQSQLDMLDSGWIHFGHTRDIHKELYHALLEGYNPSPEQRLQNGGQNFLSDEVEELAYDHPDVDRVISLYGLGSELTPARPHYSGSYVLHETLVADALGLMHHRGRQYKEEFRWHFPWWSGTYDPETGDLIETAEFNTRIEAIK